MIDNEKIIAIMDNLNLEHNAEAGSQKLPENTDLTLVKVAEDPSVFNGNNWYPVTFKDAQGNEYNKSLKSLIQGAEGLTYNSRKLSERIKAWYELAEAAAAKRKFHFVRKYDKMVTLKNKESVTVGDRTYHKGEEMPIGTDVFSSKLVG